MQASWSDDVFRLFLTTLGREPEESGLLGWSENLANGYGFNDVIALFISGPEFQIVYGETTDAEFVTLLYENVLGRGPEDVGLNGWVSNLEAGMHRVDVVAHFAQSPEFVITSHQELIDFMRDLGPDDVILGREGDDTLQGGALSDVFAFDVGEAGDNVIVDFEPWDYVQLVGSDFAAATDAIEALQTAGQDVVLEVGELSLTFLDCSTDDFDALSFIL